MIFIVLGITAICLFLCAAQGLVYIWDRLDASAPPRRAPRTPEPRRPHRAAHTVLPSRTEIGCVYALSEQFADRFREVVNS